MDWFFNQFGTSGSPERDRSHSTSTSYVDFRMGRDGPKARISSSVGSRHTNVNYTDEPWSRSSGSSTRYRADLDRPQESSSHRTEDHGRQVYNDVGDRHTNASPVHESSGERSTSTDISGGHPNPKVSNAYESSEFRAQVLSTFSVADPHTSTNSSMLAPDQITRNTRRLIDDRADNSPTYSRQEALDRAQGLHSSIESLRKDLRYTHDAKMALLRQNEELHMENERLKADLRTNRHENREFERRANYHLEEGNRTINDLQQRLSRGDELLLAQKREHATLVHATEGKQRSDQQQIDALVKEREQAISNRLKMDAFDSSVDRVSEAQLVSNMESIMSSVDDFVSVLVEEASNISPDSSKNTPILDEDASLLIQPVIHCTPGTEGWNLLLDALIHEVIIERLYSTLFSTALATPISGHIETRGRILEDLHGHIEETENWRAAQRWRSMTAKANSKLMRDSDWLPFINAASLSIRQHLAYAVHQPIEATDSLVSFIDPHITTIFNEARNLCFSATQDMVSVRIIPVLGSDEEIAQEYLWPDMGILDSDQVVSDYSLGLIKVDEAQKRTVLMHSKVASHALIRYAVKSLRRE